MNAQIAEKWIEALRSGNYTQGRFKLKSDKGYCCLGVLCELYLKENSEKENWKYNAIVNSYTIFNEYEYLPEVVQKWAEIKSDDGYLSQGVSLSSLNDRFDYNFEKIAQIIENEKEFL
jgi:hypothetical protein